MAELHPVLGVLFAGVAVVLILAIAAYTGPSDDDFQF